MTTRIQSVDALRGLIMMVMALDHTRDFFHSAAMQFQPEDLARTTTAIFFTRWITHFCAPVFMFTAGMGAFFWLQRHTKAQLSAFLAKRGLWLIVLDLTAVRFAMTWGQGMFIINVLWGLGWAMIALALLIHLPMRAQAFLSIAVMALHNLADPINLPGIHQIGVFQIGATSIVIAYTLIPWFAVMSAGFCFGEIFTKHKSWMPAIGLSLTAAFLILRTINLYGDPVRWSGGILSFLRCNKYPPSLDFLLMTLGPAILLLSFFDKRQFRPFNPLLIFGRVPLFCFLVHLYVIHLLAVLLAWAPLRQTGPRESPAQVLSARLRLRPLGGVRHLDWNRRDNLPALPVVRKYKAAPPRLVAQLSLASETDWTRRVSNGHDCEK